MCSEKPKKLLLTGFGQFPGHPVNASEVAVKLVHKYWKCQEVKLVVKGIPVSYEFVKDFDHRDQTEDDQDEEDCDLVFAVHVGVSGIADKITLERRANNSGYRRDDVDRKCPKDGKCVSDADRETLETTLNVDELVKSVNEADIKAECVASLDPGRYLCEFVYYKALHANRGEALFIHVPDIDKPYSSEETAQAINVVLEGILRQKGIPV